MSDIPFTVDLTDTSISMLTKLINHDNDTTLTSANFNVIEVSANTDPDIPRDTVAVLQGTNNPADQVTVWYNRLKADEVVGSRFPLMLSVLTEEQLVDNLPLINQLCGTAWTVEDVIDLTLQSTASGQVLEFKPDSVAWSGSLPILSFGATERPATVGQSSGSLLCFNGHVAVFSQEG